MEEGSQVGIVTVGSQRLGAPNTPFKQIHFTKICGDYPKIVGPAGENLGGTLGKSPFMYRVYHFLGYPMVILIGVKTLKMLFGSLSTP